MSNLDTLTIEELAAILKCTVQTARQRYYMGKIPFIKEERRVLFLRSDVEAYLEARKVKAA